MPLVLHVHTAGRPQRTVRCDGPVVKLGRLATAQVVIDDPTVARLHAVIELTTEGMVVTDLASAAGTLLDGVSIRRAVAKPGSELQLGSTTVVLELSDATVHEAPAQPPGAPAAKTALPDPAVEQPELPPELRRTPRTLTPEFPAGRFYRSAATMLVLGAGILYLAVGCCSLALRVGEGTGLPVRVVRVGERSLLGKHRDVTFRFDDETRNPREVELSVSRVFTLREGQATTLWTYSVFGRERLVAQEALAFERTGHYGLFALLALFSVLFFAAAVAESTRTRRIARLLREGSVARGRVLDVRVAAGRRLLVTYEYDTRAGKLQGSFASNSRASDSDFRYSPFPTARRRLETPPKPGHHLFVLFDRDRPAVHQLWDLAGAMGQKAWRRRE